MRVLIAPGPFGPGLPAVEAAAAMAAGWSRQAPRDELVTAPVSDGGAGYVDVLHHRLGGTLLAVTVPDARGVSTPAGILVVGRTAYVEAAQTVGAVLDTAADAERATSLGVGRLVAEAVRAGAVRVVVGVGATGVVTNDGGAGLLAGVGAVSDPPGALTDGPAGLAELRSVDLAPVRALLARVELVVATDDDEPLLGLLGTTKAAGSARGLTAERIPAVDALLERLADLTDRRTALRPGAGAGGGVGFALLLAGASKAPGLRTVLEEIALAGLAAAADLVVTGEDRFDLSVGSGELVTGVAAAAGSVIRPCVALANRLAVGSREARGLGLESVYSVADLAGSALPAGWSVDPAEGGEAAGADARNRLAVATQRLARTWSWSL